MDANKKLLLEEAGVDVAEASARFMNNDALLTRFLLKFPQDQNVPALRQALAAGDTEAAFAAAHTLKGVAGNLSMKEIYSQASLVTELLRGGDLDGARQQMPALEAAYGRVTDAIGTL